MTNLFTGMKNGALDMYTNMKNGLRGVTNLFRSEKKAFETRPDPRVAAME
jgi:hypothetical protein